MRRGIGMEQCGEHGCLHKGRTHSLGIMSFLFFSLLRMRTGGGGVSLFRHGGGQVSLNCLYRR